MTYLSPTTLHHLDHLHHAGKGIKSVFPELSRPEACVDLGDKRRRQPDCVGVSPAMDSGSLAYAVGLPALAFSVEKAALKEGVSLGRIGLGQDNAGVARQFCQRAVKWPKQGAVQHGGADDLAPACQRPFANLVAAKCPEQGAAFRAMLGSTFAFP